LAAEFSFWGRGPRSGDCRIGLGEKIDAWTAFAVLGAYFVPVGILLFGERSIVGIWDHPFTLVWSGVNPQARMGGRDFPESGPNLIIRKKGENAVFLKSFQLDVPISRAGGRTESMAPAEDPMVPQETETSETVEVVAPQ